MTENQIQDKFYHFLKSYLEIKLDGKTYNCPYWSNKIRRGKVVIRGFQNGKGESVSIRNELMRLLKDEINHALILGSRKNLFKFAKCHRIGIDCSGLVYQLLNRLVKIGYKNSKIIDLEDVFTGGINKTDVKLLTGQQFTKKINNITRIQLGDLIRINNGRHIALILTKNRNIITYVHSSNLTQETGVHLGKIRIINKSQSLTKQDWLEKTKTGDNFGKKYFKENSGDRFYRLKIFN